MRTHQPERIDLARPLIVEPRRYSIVDIDVPFPLALAWVGKIFGALLIVQFTLAFALAVIGAIIAFVFGLGIFAW